MPGITVRTGSGAQVTLPLVAFALGLLLAPSLGSAQNVPVRNGAGAQQTIKALSLPDGSVAPGHVEIDPSTGLPYSPTHGQPVSPAITVAHWTDQGGSVAVAGATARDIAADTLRIAGSVTAKLTNSGTITVTLKDGGGNLHPEYLSPGASFPMTVAGRVIQDEVLVSGDTVGDGFTAVTYH